MQVKDRGWVGAIGVLAALPMLLGVADCDGYDCPGGYAEPFGEVSEVTVDGVSGARYAISPIERCEADQPRYRLRVQGTGSLPMTDVRRDEVLSAVQQRRAESGATDWIAVYDYGYDCAGRWSGPALSTWGWAEADRLARTVATVLAEQDIDGEIAILLENVVYCAAAD